MPFSIPNIIRRLSRASRLRLAVAALVAVAALAPVALASAARPASGMAGARSAAGFEVGLNWSKAADATDYRWDATTAESRVVRLNVSYSSSGSDQDHPAGSIKITVPGIGTVSRGGTLAADDVAADLSGATPKTRDWSYTWDSTTDTYVFTNNHEIEARSNFSGSFEILWRLDARDSTDGYETSLVATLESSEGTASSNEVTFSFSSEKDRYSLSGTCGAIAGADGLGDDWEDYIWVKYDISQGFTQAARGNESGSLRIEAAPGAKIAYLRDGRNESQIATKSASDGVWKGNVSSYLGRGYDYDVLIGWPKAEYDGRDATLHVTLSGRYRDEALDEVLASCDISHRLDAPDFDFTYDGDLYSLAKRSTHDADTSGVGRVSVDTLKDRAELTWSLLPEVRVSQGQSVDVAVADDFTRILLADGSWHALSDDEWDVTEVTVPAASSFKDANGFGSAAGDFGVTVYARMDGDAADDWAEVRSLVITSSSQTVSLPEGTSGVMVTLTGIDHTIQSGAISVRATYRLSPGTLDEVAPGGQVRNLSYLAVTDHDTGELLNSVSRDSYVGDDADEIADADLESYGTYWQRAYGAVTVVDDVAFSEYGTTVTTSGFEKAEGGFSTNASIRTHLANSEPVEDRSRLQQIIVLPEGVTVDEESLTPVFGVSGITLANGQEADQAWADGHASIEVVANYVGTGRYVVRVTWDFTDMPVTIDTSAALTTTLTLVLAQDSYLEFGDTYQVSASTVFEEESRPHTASDSSFRLPGDDSSHLSQIGADDGTWVEDSTFGNLAGLGEDTELTYGSSSPSVTCALATHQEVKEAVRSERTDGAFVSDAKAALGETYSWRLQFTTGTMRAEDVVLFDSTTAEAGWSGTFAGVDVSWLESRGYAPAVFYSADVNAAGRADLGDGSWVPASEWGEELSGVGSVAVSLEGQTVPEGSMVYALIDMTAPVIDDLIGQLSEDLYEVTLTPVDIVTGETLEPAKLTSMGATVELLGNSGDLTIAKVDAVSGQRLRGATFSLYDLDGRLIYDGAVTNSQGEIRVRDLAYGSYVLVETSAPSGYELVSDPIQVDVYEREVEVRVEDPRSTTDVTVLKTDAQTGESLSGATFDIYKFNSEGEPEIIGTGTTDHDGTLTIEDVEWGLYQLVETACQGYELADPVSFSVTAADAASGEPVVLVVENNQKTGAATLTKFERTVEGYELGVSVPGARYDLYRGDELVASNLVTEQDGSLTVSDLLFGDYHFVETAPAAGYELNDSSIPFSINRYNVEAGVKVSHVDDQTPGTVRIVKTSEDGTYLEGAEFSIYTADGTLVAEGITTDESGTASYEGLAWGDYYVVETKAPTGFDLDETHHEFTIDHPVGSVGIAIENGKTLGSACLVKVDAENTGVRLAGAVYSLYRVDGSLVREGIETGEDGTALVEGLEWGGYYFQETKAPTGYSLSDKKVKFAVNAQNASSVQTVTAVDTKGAYSFIVTKRIGSDDVVWAHGEPTFTFKLTIGEDEYYQTVRFTEGMDADEDGMLSADVTFSGVDLPSTGEIDAEVTELAAVRYGETLVEGDAATADGQTLVLERNVSELDGETRLGTFTNVRTQQGGLSDTAMATNIIGRGRVLTSLVANYDGGEVTLGDAAGSDFSGKGLDATAFYDDGTSVDVVVEGSRAEGASYAFEGLDATQDGDYALTVTYERGGVTVMDTVLVPVRFEIKPAFAILYADGTMVFQRGDAADPDRGGEDAVVERWTGFEEAEEYSLPTDVPWYSQCAKVKTVRFENHIVPCETMWWFNSMKNVTSMDLSLLDTSNVTLMYGMFSGCSSLANIDISNIDTRNVTSMGSMFLGCSSLANIDVTYFDTCNVSSMANMFYGCSSLASIDLTTLDLHSLKDTRYMFYGCSSLTSIDVSDYGTCNLGYMEYMFANCSSLASIDVSNFDTSNVTRMNHVFFGCSSLTSIDVSNFDTSNTETMMCLFANCSSLASIDVSNFDTSKVEDMAFMFNGCNSLAELNVTNFDTGNVWDMRSMFVNCQRLSIDCSSWNVSKVTNHANFATNAPGVIEPNWSGTRSALSSMSLVSQSDLGPDATVIDDGVSSTDGTPSPFGLLSFALAS